MASINQNRWDQLVRRVAAIVGPGSKVNNTIGDLFPMLDVENMPGELLRLSNTRLGMGTATLSNVAAETPKIQLFNPAGSRLLVTLTTMVITQSFTGGISEFFLTAVPLTTNVGNTPFRDTRDGVAVSTVAQVRLLSDAAGIPAHFQYASLANTPTTFNDSNGIVVLAPGTGITIATNVANRTLTVAFMWRERVAEESELNF